MPQARHISNVYVMRKLLQSIRKSNFNETTVEVLVAEAFKDRTRTLAYLGSAKRVLEKINNPVFVAEYKKKINACWMQYHKQAEMQEAPFVPPRVSTPHEKPEKVAQNEETTESQPQPVFRLAPVPA